MAEVDDAMLAVAVLKTLSAHTRDRYELARADAASELNAGDRRVVRSPLDKKVKLGAVYMTDPKPIAVVSDKDALTEWMAANYPDLVESAYEITGSQAEVVAVLFEHAPHLLKRRTEITATARRELLNESTAIGQPVGPSGETDVPGIEIHAGEPVVGCRPSDDALFAIYELFNAGRIALDGTVRPELETPNAA